MSTKQTIKDRVRRYAPKPLLKPLQRLSHAFKRVLFFLYLLRDGLFDTLQFFRWSHTGLRDVRRRQMESAIIKSYHGFEKGLSLAQPRAGFGQDKAHILMRKLEEWELLHPETEMTAAAHAALAHYAAFNREAEVALPWLETWLARRPAAAAAAGGTIRVEGAAIRAAASGVTGDFFLSRHSIRHFGPGEVPMEDIEDAVRTAQKSPSVCNRQGVRVYCCPNAMDALKWQPGNNGFGHLASRGLVIVADLQAFGTSGERRQAFVDGGLFAMSLAYALHAKGYGSCMLAWSQRPCEERGVRKALRIGDNEVIIMMMAVGRLPETLEVACSHRRPLSDVLELR